MNKLSFKDVIKEIVIAVDEIRRDRAIKEDAGDDISPLDIPIDTRDEDAQALAADDNEHSPLDIPVDADNPEPEVVDAPPEEAPEEYTVVGETRRLTAHSISPNFVGESPMIGEAWQDDQGKLYGTGVFYVMLFEPLSQIMYRNSSIGLDVSPLALLASRVARSPFTVIRWVDDAK